LTPHRHPAVILAGGLGSRMGGADKALLQLGGQALIGHSLARLALQCGQVAVNANGDPARFAGFGLPVLPDSVAGYPGPLAGVLAAMDWAADMGFAQVVTVAGDTPFFPTTLAARLTEHARPDAPSLALLLSPEPRAQPAFGPWPVSLRQGLRADLRGGMRKMRLWADACGATYAPFDDDSAAFFNINTPDDLCTAEALLARLTAAQKA